MTVRTLSLLSAVFLLSAGPALAGDDDLPEPDIFDEDDDDEEEEDAPARPTDEDKPIDLEDDPDPEEEKKVDPLTIGGGDDKFFEEEIGEDRIGGEGVDSAKIYRDYLDQVKDYLPDEELIAWERYLKKYPKTLFRNRVEARMEELEGILYDQQLGGEDGRLLDADQREILFSQALTLENIDPRQRFMVGFEWGLPDYVNLVLDYEHALLRNLSAHAGIRRRYAGYGLELGPRFALVKSSRTRTLLTAMVDLQFSGVPTAFFGVRPALAFGQSFGPVDVQLHAGGAFDFRKNASVKVLGGGNVTIKAAQNVSIFLEGNVWMGGFSFVEGDTFRFNTGSFGLKFYPKINGNIGDVEVNVGASAPFATNYWMYHYGSIMGQLVYYLDRNKRK